MTTLPRRIVALHRALAAGKIAHAFGGALALAWCTQQARGTIDIDVNIFVSTDHADDVIAALPSGVRHSEADLAALHRVGQTRLWWDETPVDLFLNTTEFHEEAALRIHWEPFANAELPFLSCTDLAVFKAFFNRTRDWADLEDMAAAGTLQTDRILGVLVQFLGPSDERIERLRSLDQK